MKRTTTLAMVIGLSLLSACATRPVNPPITQTDPRSGYRFDTRQAQSQNSKDNLVILGVSGGGARAAALKDKKELAYLNTQPTTFVLEPEAVDRLRSAGGTIILESPEFKRLLQDLGAMMVPQSPAAGSRVAP